MNNNIRLLLGFFLICRFPPSTFWYMLPSTFFPFLSFPFLLCSVSSLVLLSFFLVTLFPLLFLFPSSSSRLLQIPPRLTGVFFFSDFGRLISFITHREVILPSSPELRGVFRVCVIALSSYIFIYIYIYIYIYISILLLPFLSAFTAHVR